MSKERPTILEPPAGDPYLHRVRWWDHVGRPRQKSYRGHDERTGRAARKRAEAKVDELIGKAQRGERTHAAKTTVEEFFDEWWENVVGGPKIGASTANSSYGPAFEHRILPYMGQATLASIDGETIDKFIGWMGRQGNAPQTIRNTITALSSMLKTARKWKRITHNPCHGAFEEIEVPDANRRAFTVDELTRLAGGMLLDRDKALVWFAAWFGRRKDDIYQLTWDCFTLTPPAPDDPDGRWTGEARVWQKKSQTWDEGIALFEPAILALLWWREIAPHTDPHHPVFASSAGTSLSKQASSWYRRRWFPGCARAGMLTCANARCKAMVETDEETAQRVGVDPSRGRQNLEAWTAKSEAHARGAGPKPRGPRPIDPWSCPQCGCAEFVGPVFHELRHSFGSNVAAATGDLKYTADQGGWSNTKTLERRYRKKVAKGQDEARDKVNDAARRWLS